MPDVYSDATEAGAAAAWADPCAEPRAMADYPGETPIADLVEKMLSGGTPVELVVLAVRTVELARGATDPVAERRRAFDRERNGRASAKAPPAESQHAPPAPELHKKSSVVAKPFASNRSTRIPNNWVPDEKWLPSLTENDGGMS
jgi:hypothetical protein